MPTKKTAKKPMSDDHKKALAKGREEGRAVRAYLEALDTTKPKRGRKRTPESIRSQLATIERDLPTADPMKRLDLTQRQMDLEAELATLEGGTTVDLVKLEAAFVKSAKSYSERKGITRAAWRKVGVPAAVLSKAGV